MRTMERSKREQERFARLAGEHLRSLGAKHTPDGWYPYQLQTRAGTLRLDPRDSAVYCRFEDVEQAKAICDPYQLNPYSGKWNHHYFGGWTVEDALWDFQMVLARIL